MFDTKVLPEAWAILGRYIVRETSSDKNPWCLPALSASYKPLERSDPNTGCRRSTLLLKFYSLHTQGGCTTSSFRTGTFHTGLTRDKDIDVEDFPVFIPCVLLTTCRYFYPLLENRDNDMALDLIAIIKLRLSDVWGPSQTSIEVALIIVF